MTDPAKDIVRQKRVRSEEVGTYRVHLLATWRAARLCNFWPSIPLSLGGPLIIAPTLGRKARHSAASYSTYVDTITRLPALRDQLLNALGADIAAISQPNLRTGLPLSRLDPRRNKHQCSIDAYHDKLVADLDEAVRRHLTAQRWQGMSEIYGKGASRQVSRLPKTLSEGARYAEAEIYSQHFRDRGRRDAPGCCTEALEAFSKSPQERFDIIDETGSTFHVTSEHSRRSFDRTECEDGVYPEFTENDAPAGAGG